MPKTIIRLPDVGNVDPEKLREFRDEYMKHVAQDSTVGDDNNDDLSAFSITMDKLNIQGFKKKLIGRDDEVQQLKSVFAKTAQGQGPTVTTIIGTSGTGKSVLARQIQSIVLQESGFFCTGQFSGRNEPYTGFSHALSDLTQQILSRDEAFVNEFVDRIEEKIADDIPILTSFVPELTKLGFKSTSSSLLGSQFQQHGNDIHVANKGNQLYVILRKFLKVLLCHEKIPLVFVLDDVHLADTSSALLMTSLATEKENSYLCFIATSHPDTDHTSPVFESLELLNIPTTEILLDNLSFEQAHEMVCIALRSNPTINNDDENKNNDENDDENSNIETLSKLVYEKTHGNPFFSVAFLRSLAEEHLLNYDSDTKSFTWDLNAAKEKSATSNVGDLTAASLGKLSLELQSILQVASCLPQTFNKEELYFVMSGVVEKSTEFNLHPMSLEDLDGAFKTLCRKGILQGSWVPNTFTFVHEQTLKASFNLVPYSQRKKFQLIVGQRLFEGMDNQTKTDKYICLATDLCNNGANLLEPSERITVAEWNLKAGDFTLERGAFASALNYFETGINYLGRRDFWEKHTKLALDLHSGAVEAAYCTGDFDKHETYATAVLACDELFTVQECLRIHASRISVNGAQENDQKAIEIGRFVLKELGILDMPAAPGMVTVVKDLVKTKRVAKGLTREKLLALPLCKDPNRIAAMKIITLFGQMAYRANPNFYLVVFLKFFRWTIKYGVSQYAPIAIISYGIVLCSIHKDIKEGLKFGEAALELAKVRNFRVQRCAAISAYYGFVYHWAQPYREALLPLAYGRQLGMETGETEVAFICCTTHDAMMMLAGAKPLQELAIDVELRCKEMVEFKQDNEKTFHAVLWQTILNMIGDKENNNSRILTGTAMNENRTRRLAQAKNYRFLEVFMDEFRLFLAYLFGAYNEALKIAESTMDYGVDVGVGVATVPRHSLMVGLVHVAVMLSSGNNNNKKENKEHLKVATTMKKRLQDWSKAGNVNCLHYFNLLDAELAMVQFVNDKRGSVTAVEKLYKDAIAAAIKGEFINDQALANERAAIFFLQKNSSNKELATKYMKNAVQCYRDWGATMKVQQLQSNHGALLPDDSN